jgi:hypothetical protein
MCTPIPVRHSTSRMLALITSPRRTLTNAPICGNIATRRPLSSKVQRNRQPVLRRPFISSSVRLIPNDDAKGKSSSKSSKYDALKQTGSASSLLDTHINRAAASAKMGAGRPGSDGTFYLGIRPGDTELPKGYKNWKELGVGGKGQLEPLAFFLLLIVYSFHGNFCRAYDSRSNRSSRNECFCHSGGCRIDCVIGICFGHRTG